MNHPRREREREYLTPEEAQKLLEACRQAQKTRNRERDYCLLLLMYHHGLRVSEACQLKVTDIDLQAKRIHINRLKKGEQTSQPLYNGEVGAVNAWLKVRKQMQPHSDTPYQLADEAALPACPRGSENRAFEANIKENHSEYAFYSATMVHYRK